MLTQFIPLLILLILVAVAFYIAVRVRQAIGGRWGDIFLIVVGILLLLVILWKMGFPF